MQISIKTLKGNNINLEVDDSSNAIGLKIHGEPIGELVLRLGPLPGRREAAMRIFVKTLTGKTRNFQVKGSDTIGEVKSKWEEVEGVPVDQLRLIFAGKQLEDSHTVAECSIKHDSTLVMMHRLCETEGVKSTKGNGEVGFAMQISIQTVEGKSINLEVEDSSKTIDLKIYGPTRQLVLGLNPNADHSPDAAMRIFVSTIKERTFKLMVKRSDTIKKVKTMIHDQGGPPVDKLNLNFLGTKLENSRTISDYNIKPDSNLVIVQKGCIC